jgi:hypothetical protein
LAGAIKGDVVSLLKRAVLGNIYTYSLTQIGSEIESAAQGNLIKAGQTVKQYIKNAQQRAAMKNKKHNPGNIYGSVEELVQKKPTGDIFPDEVVQRKHQMRDIYENEVERKKHQMRDIFPDEADQRKHQMGDIYENDVERKKHVSRDIYPEPPRPKKQNLGNIFNKATIANN